MADKVNPNANNNSSSNFLPRFYRTDSNKKFIQATVDQLVNPGTVKKINSYIGRQNAKSATGDDIFLAAPSVLRQQYQLEPGLVVDDALGNNTFFKDYQDYINQLSVFGGNLKNHERLNREEFYSWDPHINWDKFVNFQNYYWLPYGPDVITVYGKSNNSSSTYNVIVESQLDNNAYIFSPDSEVGLVRNPTIKLYRGETYTFNVNSPGNPFTIRTAKSTNTVDRYTTPGLTGNGTEVGDVVFTVPHDAPDVLFYQSESDLDLGGVFQILEIIEDTSINVSEEIIGKSTYTLPNGVPLTNGMKLRFVGNVTPLSYASGRYYVEGVGKSINLINEESLQLISNYTKSESIQFDSTPFDTMPFSDAMSFPGTRDYITINRSSVDQNPWSRYNRWFHKDVIEASAVYNGKVMTLDQDARAVRPIIEFEANLRLFNFGAKAIGDVDLIDTYTTDVFSTIEGQLGYNIDGIQLSQGLRVLFTNDPDPFVKNKIFLVTFSVINGTRQIHLELETTPEVDDVVLVKQGIQNQGVTYWHNESSWVKAQEKVALNQAPLFDVFDDAGISYSDINVYDGTTFKGTPLFSYKSGSGAVDTNLGFALSYKNINNIGDIVFNFNLIRDTFQYKNVAEVLIKKIDTGYLKQYSYSGTNYVNGWQLCTSKTVQPAIRIYKNSNLTNNFLIDIFDDLDNLTDLVVKIYVNGIRLDKQYWSVTNDAVYKKIVLKTDIAINDILTIKAFASQQINSNGYYEIPINLQNNPLNESIGDFTLGEVIDHVGSIVDNLGNFSGTYPGASNLRDLGNITQYGVKFVQHSGPLSLSLYHITSSSNNIVRALEQSRDDYNKFKRNFIAVSQTLGVDTNVIDHVDLILKEINKDKPTTFPYYFSDMAPYGSSIKSVLTVVDYRVKTYPLSQVFSLSKLSSNAVLIYVNSEQLLYGRDYTFSDQGFVVISSTLHNDDEITIYEYENTNGSFIPATPTKLGIWPKFEPVIYTDTSLVTPRLMIQGHDGSQTLAYGDYRDALILELEKRIFNNIKVQYDETIFDIYDFIPGYSRTTDYSLAEVNEVLAPSFYKWTTLIDRDFSKPLSYDRNNSMTFNYRGHAAPDGREVPGYWRGIYRWMLDTDRPNLCPWEMLGFSQSPTWWTSVYGPAPYTSENKILWQDLASGLVKEPGKKPYKRLKFAKPFLIDHIPVDDQGNLVSPLISGLATGIITGATTGDYVFGDVSPVESAWRRSSHYPFSVLLTSMILQPAKTFGLLLDRSRVVRNIANQLVYKDTGLRITPASIVLPSIYSSKENVQTAGIINYIVDYILSDNLKSYDEYNYDLSNLNVKLSHRIGAFTSKEKFNLLLDSKTPLSQSSVFVPQEDYNIILNSSSPVKKITYSGVIIVKLDTGFEVKGYSKTQPYFKYYPWTQTGVTVNVGGISESYSIWTPNSQYAAGKVIQYNNRYYRVLALHTTDNTFNDTYYQALSGLPVIGGCAASLRKSWDRSDPITVPYGTTFRAIQDVVDFLLGYGEWLKDQGFIFDDFNNELSAITNWETSSKEFLFWTTQNWSTGEDKWDEWIPNTTISIDSIVRYNGDYYRAIRTSAPATTFTEDDFVKLDGLSTIGSSVISLSPAAAKLTFSAPLCVVDDIRNAFNGYEIFKVDGTPIQPNFLNSYREDNAVSYTPVSEDGIYGASFYLVQKEQVAIINNATMFNDTIYHPQSGYRQERIKTAGYISTNWYGGFDVPGFIFDQATIQLWEAWKDYALGDIVKYKEFYYSATQSLVGTEAFNANQWNILDSVPTPQLLPNWTYKASQMTDFYSLDSDNFDSSQQQMAQHLIGYQPRQYLSNIIKDDVSEFKFYQGMIVEKGTQNAFNKLFDVLSADGKESLTFYEEWAVRVGEYGASEAFDNIEFILDESKFKNNPQGFELVNSIDSSKVDFIYRQTPADIYLKPVGYNNNPWPILSDYKPFLRTPGYVRTNEVKVVVSSLDDMLTQDINSFVQGDYVWCGFEGRDWNVYRFSDSKLRATGVAYNSADSEITVTTRTLTNLVEGDIIGIDQAIWKIGTTEYNFNGFYKVKSVTLNSFVISATVNNWVSPFTGQARMVIAVLKTHRTSTIDNADSIIPIPAEIDELIWTDDAGNGKWATWQYNPVYVESQIVNQSPADSYGYGRKIAVNSLGTISAISNNAGEIIIYDRPNVVSSWIQRQTLSSPIFANPTLTPASYTGDVLAFSLDGRWFASGTPKATSSTIVEYGSVSLYEKDDNNIFTLVKTITAPIPLASDRFGSTIVFGVDTLFISAPGYNNNAGRVFQLNYTSTASATTFYNPTGSVGSTIKVSSTSGIIAGMTVLGTGFSSQTVTEVVNSTTLILNGSPDSTPAGELTFVTVDWTFASPLTLSASVAAGSLYGDVISISNDGNTLAVSAPGTNSPGKVHVYKGLHNTFTLLQTISGADVKFGHSTAASNDGTYLAISSIFADLEKVDQGNVTVYQYGIVQTVDAKNFVPGYLYKIVEPNNTDFILNGASSNDAGTVFTYKPAIADAGAFVVGKRYTIYLVGTTDFTLIGASDNIPGTEFTATGIGVGSGQATSVGTGTAESFPYEPYQDLVNRRPEPAELFGSKLAFMNDDKTLVVYSQNADSYVYVTFDRNTTTFDDYLTKFVSGKVDSGRVDIYDRYSTKWIYSESLLNDNLATASYGAGIAVTSNAVLIGAPYTLDQGFISGKVFEYKKAANDYSWKVLHYEIDKPNANKIKQAFLYNKETNKLVTYLDVIDSNQGKIPGIADREIKYKTFYDPAVYSVGTSGVNVDDGMSWSTNQVGMLWWDLRTAKFFNSYDNDIFYRNSTWNTLFPGASIDVYEWVETKLLPADWDLQADTEEGLTAGISGTSLYGNSVYSVVRTYDTTSKTFKNTYYYWVKNKKTTPNVANRNMSSQDVSSLISNPRGQGHKYIALTSSNSFSLVNVAADLEDKNVVLSVEYWIVDNTDGNVHTQWKLISNNDNSNIPPAIEQKWINSLCGKDANDRPLPDMNLPVKLRYGIEDRPRQSMFVNRFEALKQLIEQVNRTLIRQVVEKKSIASLELFDTEPTTVSGLYDSVKDTDAELKFVSVSAFKKPSLAPVIVDGRITSVTISDKGAGYLVAPYITVNGAGTGAKIRAVIDTLGRVVDVNIISSGYGYDDNTTLLIRNYSVLVHSDSQANNVWSIYSYEPTTYTWSRIQSQSYDTRNYWSYIDWYATGYNQFVAINKSVSTLSELFSIEASVGDVVKILRDNSGNWLLLKKYADSTSVDWTQSYTVIGLQNGTIQFSSSLYQFSDTSYGYDGSLYDGSIFDNSASKELRIILNSLKDNILIDNLKSKYLDLFFTCVRYAFSEQNYLDWVFKTSFVKAKHNVGELTQKVTYNNDNLSDFEAYVAEVKPYRTKIREYVSTYDKVDLGSMSVTDFDIPPVYENNILTPIDTRVVNGKIEASSNYITQYPWKHWYDNAGYRVISIQVVDGGAGYQTEPVVKIENDSGSGATARAFISNGKVTRILLLTQGAGYLSAPTVLIEGGTVNDASAVTAKAVAIIGDGVVRSNLIKMKFDRITQTYFVAQLQETESMVGTGSRLQFPLKWAPDIRIGKSVVTVNSVDSLRDDYKLSIVKSTTRGYTSYSGSITFNTAPAKDSVITITYIKDWSLLNAADRIQFYYDPATGELGKDLAQLMTGVDYGGVIIDGLDFEVNLGWDSLPFYSDRWDTFDPTFDDYIVTAAANQHSFTLVYTPTAGTELNVYRNGVRIDDPAWGTPQQTNSNAEMATIIATGLTDIVTIPSGITIAHGDTIIIRKTTSDGSIKPLDADYDTALTGGNLAYSTATGLAADDIIVDGDGFVTPTSSPATEEVVPGQVVDAVAIKVFDKPHADSAEIKVDSYLADGTADTFSISQQPNTPQAVIVRTVIGTRDINNVLSSNVQIMTIGTDYTVDYTTRQIKFVNPPAAGVTVSIVSLGFNGSNILDIDYFVADGVVTEFITDAPWVQPVKSLVYVDGLIPPTDSPQLFETDSTYESSKRIGIRFGNPPAAGTLINYVLVSGDAQTFSLAKSEKVLTNGSATYQLTNVIGEALPNEANMIVRVDQSILRGPNISYFDIKSNRLSYQINHTKFLPNSVSIEDIEVYAAGNLLTPAVDYTVDLSGITIKINKIIYSIYAGKKLSISIASNSEYTYTNETVYNVATLTGSITGTTLLVDTPLTGSLVAGMILTGNNVVNGTKIVSGAGNSWVVNKSNSVTTTTITGTVATTAIIPKITFKQLYDNTHLVEVTSFYKHDILDIQRTALNISNNLVLTEDTAEYYNYKSLTSGVIPLDRTVLDDSYIWVVQGDKLLVPSVDFKLNEDRQSITLAIIPALDDEFTLITFSENVFNRGISYMQFKDMINRTHYKRLSANKQTRLTVALKQTDTTITVDDASNFDIPNPLNNKPGIVEIRGERIEYFSMTGNVLGQLRRGTLGTGVPTIHNIGSFVQDIGSTETIAYADGFTIENFESTGSNIVDLKFVPTKTPGSWSYDSGFISTIPASYGQSDDIEVFAAGVRLRKMPYKVHNVAIHSESPEGDEQFDAEFAVDGVSGAVRLTTPAPEGTRITVVKKTGQTWDSAINILHDTNSIANFLKATPGIWYTEMK